MESSVTVSSLAIYIAITHYYWEVIQAFCKEIEDDVPKGYAKSCIVQDQTNIE
jgi:hypothetical protein